jgi:hypothetical protein
MNNQGLDAAASTQKLAKGKYPSGCINKVAFSSQKEASLFWSFSTRA